MCVRVRVRSVCGEKKKGKNRKKKKEKQSERGENRTLLLPPSLSHFQPGLNFDPASGYMYCPDLLEALRRGAHNFQPRHEEHLQRQDKSPVKKIKEKKEEKKIKKNHRAARCGAGGGD